MFWWSAKQLESTKWNIRNTVHERWIGIHFKRIFEAWGDSDYTNGIVRLKLSCRLYTLLFPSLKLYFYNFFYFQNESSERGQCIFVKSKCVKQMDGGLKAMVPNIQMLFDRLSYEMIQPTELMQPTQYKEVPSPASSSDLNVDESSGDGSERRYFAKKRKFKKNSSSLYIWCLKRNLNRCKLNEPDWRTTNSQF